MYEKIISLLERQGKSISDLSKSTGIKENVFSNLRKRNGNLSVKNAKRVAKALGVTLDDLCNTDK